MNPKKTINELITNGEISKAILIFNDYFNDSVIEKELQMVTSRFKRAESEKIQGIISDDKYNLEANKITSTLIDLLNQVTEFDVIKSFKRKIKFSSELGFFNSTKIRINEASDFRFLSYPDTESGLHHGGEYKPGKEFLINSTLIKVFNPGTIQGHKEEWVEGIGYGAIDFLSKERFENAIQYSKRIDMKPGYKLEYLCPINAEKSIIKMWNEIIVIQMTQNLEISEQPLLEVWTHATLLNGHRLGWFLVNNKVSII